VFKILIIDDDSTTLQLLDFLLTRHKYKVTLSPGGEDGIKKAQKIIPDLIILDVMMPQIDGIAVCKKLRKIEDTAEIPILFLSALGRDTDVMDGLMAGGDGYIVKPFDTDHLLTAIENLIKKKKAHS